MFGEVMSHPIRFPLGDGQVEFGVTCKNNSLTVAEFAKLPKYWEGTLKGQTPNNGGTCFKKKQNIYIYI